MPYPYRLGYVSVVFINEMSPCFSGVNSLSRLRTPSLSSKTVIKEGQIEKRGHSAAFLTWSKYGPRSSLAVLIELTLDLVHYNLAAIVYAVHKK